MGKKIKKKYILKNKISVILMNCITFARNELFSFDELEDFFDATPVSRAERLAEKLEQHLLISKNILYLYKPTTVSYTVIKPDHATVLDYLLMYARQFIVNSYDHIDGMDKPRIIKMYKKDGVFNLSYYRDFILDVYCKITNDYISFDDDKNEVHYRNGFIDLKSLKFLKRDPSEHFITKFYNHEYYMEDVEEEEEEVEVRPPKKVAKKAVIVEEEEEEYEEEEEEVVPKKPQFTKKQIKDVIDKM